MGSFILEYNKPLLVAALGALATIPYEIFTRILIYFGIGKFSVYQLSSLIVTLDRPTTIIGMVVCCIVAGTYAISFYYSLKIIGSDYIIFKGITSSLLLWVSMESIYVWLIEGPQLIQPRPVSDYYLQLLGTFLFGLIFGLFFKRYILKRAIY